MGSLLGWSFSAGKLFGIPIRVHWTMILLSAFWVLSETTPIGMGWQLAVCLILWFTVLVHELGHAFAARGVGGQAREILLWPLGGLAYTTHRGGLIEDIKVVLGGPLTHIPLGLLFARLFTLQGVKWDWHYLNPFTTWPMLDGGFWTYLAFYGLKIQVVLLLFNLCVPVYPLDGGHLLANLLRFRLSRETTAKIVMVLSTIAGFALLSLGRIFLTVWIFYETYQMYAYYLSGALREHPMFRIDSPADSKRKVVKKPKASGPAKILQFPNQSAVKNKSCPYCQQSLPSSAVMCGRCEKMLPK